MLGCSTSHLQYIVSFCNIHVYAKFCCKVSTISNNGTVHRHKAPAWHKTSEQDKGKFKHELDNRLAGTHV